MSVFRDIRVLPVVLVAIFCLAVLKIAGLVLDGGYVFDYNPDAKQKSWAQQTFNFPGGRQLDNNDITGSVPEKKEEPKKAEGKPDAKPDGKPDVAAPQATKPESVASATTDDPPASVSPSERAILERLQARRQELDARAREIDIRESLLKSTEKRIDGKVDELKGVEASIKTATDQKSDADSSRFKGIVTMYENMKPKDAAKIFDRLDMSVLFDIASQIAPRKMADILGAMQPESAERLTTELARRASGGDRSASANDLPKIEGRPTIPGQN